MGKQELNETLLRNAIRENERECNVILYYVHRGCLVDCSYSKTNRAGLASFILYIHWW